MVKCPADGDCIVENGIPRCQCKDATQCSNHTKEVCGTDGKTYRNKCALRVVSCKGPKKIKVAREGSCGTFMSLHIYFLYSHCILCFVVL